VAIPVPFASHSSVLRPTIPNRVLVVDDEPLIRWSLCTALEAAGFDAISAADGVEARRAATEWPPPRVAVVDLLGAQDAGGLLDFVRRIYPDCKFVLMTTSRRSPAEHDDDGVRVIEKPFDLHELITVIGGLLESPSGPLSQPGWQP
jgi:two-component system OmpR family response regulator